MYDSLKRVKEIHRWIGTVERYDQRVNLYYDSNPFDASYGTNLTGRLAVTESWLMRKNPTWVGANTTPWAIIREMYKYDQAGLVQGKRVWFGSNGAADWLDASYTYDTEGKMLTQTYPDALAMGASYGSADTVGEKFNLHV